MDANEAKRPKKDSKSSGGSWIDRFRLKQSLSKIRRYAKKGKDECTIDLFLWFGFGNPSYVFNELERLGFGLDYRWAGWAYVSWRTNE